MHSRTIPACRPDELDGRHPPNLVPIGLPERAMEWAAGFPAPTVDDFRNFELVEIGTGQPPLIGDDRLSGVGIHQAAGVWS